MSNKKLREELIEFLFRTLHKYLEKQGRKIVSMTKATGQRSVKIALRGLFWFYESNIPEYPKLTHLVEEILNNSALKEKLESLGFKIIIYDGEYYIETSVKKIMEFMEEENRS